MANKSLFEKIVDNEIPSFKVWEDADYLAFLTPFPNTPGQTVVVPKRNPGGYVFNLDDDALAALVVAAKKVAKLLEKALAVDKVAMVFEGEGVEHVHAKLYPMHAMEADRSNFPEQTAFFKQYPGYIATYEGPRMSDDQLQEIQAKIKKAAV